MQLLATGGVRGMVPPRDVELKADGKLCLDKSLGLRS